MNTLEGTTSLSSNLTYGDFDGFDIYTYVLQRCGGPIRDKVEDALYQPVMYVRVNVAGKFYMALKEA